MASSASIRIRITAVPTSVSVAENSVEILGHELVERLHVIREPRDQHARLVAREPDRQPLEMLEHLDAEVLERPLADPVDEEGLRASRPS